MYKKIDDKEFKDYDLEVIAWHRKDGKDLAAPLIYSFPQPGDNIKKKKFFAVKDYEKVLFYNKGSLVDILEGGIYELEKNARIKGTEIIWIYNSMVEIPWGIPLKNGIPTKEGLMIGLHGDLKLIINDAKTFYTSLIGGKKEWIVQDLKDWIMSLLYTSLRDIIKKYKVKSIMLEEREMIKNFVTKKIIEEFSKFGLFLETFNIIGLQTSEDIQELLDQEKEKLLAVVQATKESLGDIIQQKKYLQNRIRELNEKEKELQDKLLNDEIKKAEFDAKKSILDEFIKDAQQKLKYIEEKISK